jgi:outer membrane protein assembly factor BamB
VNDLSYQEEWRTTRETNSLFSRHFAYLAGFFFLSFSIVNAADWPQWRGPTRNAYAPTDSPVITALPKELQPVWKLSIGGGFSSPIVASGKLVYLDEQNGKEVAHLLDASTGKELWRVAYASSFQDEWGGGPRSTPLIDSDRLYVQSCDGEFRCLNLADGKDLWSVSFEKDFGVKFLGSKVNEGTATRRGNNGSGVIDGERLILPVGSTQGASLVCFNKLSGKVLWKAGSDEAAYSSLMIATLAGMRQVVAFTADALLGAELETGRLLWRVPFKTDAKRHAGSPVIIGDTVIVNSQTIGLVATRISADSGGQKASEAWANKNLKINLATPVLVGDYLYSQGVSPNYICASARTGELKWTQPGFPGGKEAYCSTIVTGKNLLVLTHDGQLLLLAADPTKYTELGRLQVCGKTWSFPALADGKLFVRDERSLVCLDLAGKAR